MKMIILNIVIIAFALFFKSCEKEELTYNNGDIEIKIETGEHWFHDFPLFLGFSKKNAPQFAVWMEDTTGQYLSTLFVTHKIATEGWVANKGNRRKETLPHWCYQRGVTYNDGLMLPTKENPLTDGITGATPEADKTLRIKFTNFDAPVVIKAEFNHSVDFNDHYPENATKEAENYSGGNMGSGQPAIVYAATIYPTVGRTELKLAGRSSPDGSNGIIYQNMEGLSSAKSIVKNITITIK